MGSASSTNNHHPSPSREKESTLNNKNEDPRSPKDNRTPISRSKLRRERIVEQLTPKNENIMIDPRSPSLKRTPVSQPSHLFDPRSPSLNRTPISQTGSFDPRSPSLTLNRTPQSVVLSLKQEETDSLNIKEEPVALVFDESKDEQIEEDIQVEQPKEKKRKVKKSKRTTSVTTLTPTKFSISNNLFDTTSPSTTKVLSKSSSPFEEESTLRKRKRKVDNTSSPVLKSSSPNIMKESPNTATTIKSKRNFTKFSDIIVEKENGRENQDTVENIGNRTYIKFSNKDKRSSTTTKSPLQQSIIKKETNSKKIRPLYASQPY